MRRGSQDAWQSALPPIRVWQRHNYLTRRRKPPLYAESKSGLPREDVDSPGFVQGVVRLVPIDAGGGAIFPSRAHDHHSTVAAHREGPTELVERVGIRGFDVRLLPASPCRFV